MPTIHQFTNEATTIAEADYVGIDQDIGGGNYQTAKIKKGQAYPIFVGNLNGVDSNTQELVIQKLLLVPAHIQDASWWNSATRRYTPLRAGFYKVDITIQYKNIIAGLIYFASAFLYKNNAVVAVGINNAPGFVNPISVQLSAVVEMNGTTDFMDFRADFFNLGPVLGVNGAVDGTISHTFVSVFAI
jgi:hypothetical protein